MAEAIQAQQEPEYGAKVAVENTAEAVASTQPAPGTPFLMAEGDEEGVAPGAQQAAGGQQSFTVKNPYMLLPTAVNFPQMQRPKTQVERNYDAGLLWEVLASDQRADPLIRFIAEGLKGGTEPW